MKRQRGNAEILVPVAVTAAGLLAFMWLAWVSHSQDTQGQCFKAGFAEYASTSAGNRYCIDDGRAVPLHTVKAAK